MTTKEAPEPVNLEAQKEQMFEKLIERGISQPTLDAMRKVPRELFAPDDRKHLVYDFESILLEAENSSISAPQVVADMIDMLDPSPEDHVFELGTATGYQAAVLSHLTKQVTTAEINESLALRALANFEELGLNNIESMIGDGTLLHHEAGRRFNKVIVTASIYPSLQNGIFNLLEEGGICIAPIGGEYASEILCRLTKLQKQSGEMKILDAKRNYVFVPLEGEWGWKSLHASIAMRNFMELFGESEPEYIKQRQQFIIKNQEIITLETEEFISDLEEE